MADQATPLPSLPLTCTVVDAKVDLGPGYAGTNTIVLRITNTTAQPITFSGPGTKGELTLSISTGNGPDNLATLEDSVKLKIEYPKLWQLNPLTTTQGQATWSFRLPKPAFQANEYQQLTLSKFESKVDPGQAKITISAKISGYAEYKQILSVEKKAEQFSILYFTADPPYLITDADKKHFRLTWNTVKAQRAALYGFNRAKLEEFHSGSAGCISGKPYVYDKERPWAPTTTYELEIIDGEKTKRVALSVPVLSSGWHTVSFDYGYPAVLCNMNDQELYGIFVKEGKGRLYSSTYPYATWQLKHEHVPDGMLTSPAVYWQNALWLIGGGAADPKLRNNHVWSYDEKTGEWRQHDDAPWTRRMGQACVIFNKRLLVLGGNDETGTSVNDVWAATLTGEQLSWEKLGNETVTPRWRPRCMFAATATRRGDRDKLWLYGGLTEPFSDPLDDMWSSEDGKTWVQYATTPRENNNPAGKPIAAALMVIKEKLTLFGSFRSGTTVKQKKFILQEGQNVWNSDEVPTGWDDQGGNTFSLAAVQYKGLIFLRSLDYRTRRKKEDVVPSLYLHVP